MCVRPLWLSMSRDIVMELPGSYVPSAQASAVPVASVMVPWVSDAPPYHGERYMMAWVSKSYMIMRICSGVSSYPHMSVYPLTSSPLQVARLSMMVPTVGAWVVKSWCMAYLDCP